MLPIRYPTQKIQNLLMDITSHSVKQLYHGNPLSKHVSQFLWWH
jgi:hypothetical protein